MKILCSNTWENPHGKGYTQCRHELGEIKIDEDTIDPYDIEVMSGFDNGMSYNPHGTEPVLFTGAICEKCLDEIKQKANAEGYAQAENEFSDTGPLEETNDKLDELSNKLIRLGRQNHEMASTLSRDIKLNIEIDMKEEMRPRIEKELREELSGQITDEVIKEIYGIIRKRIIEDCGRDLAGVMARAGESIINTGQQLINQSQESVDIRVGDVLGTPLNNTIKEELNERRIIDI
jgi:hypothetical protein